ncbi:MAG: pectate lyase [Phycisphaerae bacterium]|nr:pectate lyase [Phycisphaerae bacterium]
MANVRCCRLWILAATLPLAVSRAWAVPAFPGAEGFGAGAIGGRGGEVYHVTRLDDDPRDPEVGSLRHAVAAGDRIIVFDVGGYIDLKDPLGVTVSNITLAGQTAPGGGVGLRGRKFSVGGRNIIVRGMRFRYGRTGGNGRNDAVNINDRAENVLFDHCSVQFGQDENFSMIGRNITVQWCIIAWGLQPHSCGSLLTANNTTIHHTLWAHNHTRNPKARGQVLDWINNVVYDWDIPFIAGDTVNGQHAANIRGCVFIAGPGKPTDKAVVKGRLNAKGVPTFSLYMDNTIFDGNANGVLEWYDAGWEIVDGQVARSDAPHPAAAVTVDDPMTAFRRIVEEVGAVCPQRDQVDALLVRQLLDQQGGIIASQAELGLPNDGFGELAAGTPPPDTDRDGMPDDWERKHGLDPNDPADRNGDVTGDGYTHVEKYLNSLLPAPPPQPPGEQR